MVKWSVRLLLAAIAVLLAAIAGFVIYAQFDYGPSAELKERVAVDALERDGSGLIFQPEKPNGKGVILYQGAKVEAAAYAYLAEKLQAAGYTVAIPDMPLKFPILAAGKADEVIATYPAVEKWFIGGHSLGGVAAAQYAEEHQDELAGLYFLAAYPVGDFALSDLPMLSVSAENDGLTLPQDIKERQMLFSANSEFIEIAGGNHAQFGLYGEQKNDLPAAISPLDQQDQVAQALLDWMANK
ncbi:dienelactone hydrolase [Planomicrobium koreense]|uniref:Dienelactone hydrolase n=1 Tax=Planococcus koreensis TaxID=112331 RepID=A0A7W8FUT8_9BACL|nr:MULTISPECIES: alpha/beta hydrolase [Planococcus]MBB5181466.1 dienelactone hydrolase [Planococcus koreensis]MDN3449031.1 alpha/beta hydrolase [Planococcus sp. APC 3906]